MILGFAPTNHPQQVARRGACDKVDERITPDWLFQEENTKHRFNLDAAASAANAKCRDFWTVEDDGLRQPWAPHRAWCNPPYSAIGSWVDKAWREHRAGCPVIVMLLPANRTEQPWWHEFIEPYRDGRGPIETRFIRRRFNFGLPEGSTLRWDRGSPFACVLVTWRMREAPIE